MKVTTQGCKKFLIPPYPGVNKMRVGKNIKVYGSLITLLTDVNGTEQPNTKVKWSDKPTTSYDM